MASVALGGADKLGAGDANKMFATATKNNKAKGLSMESIQFSKFYLQTKITNWNSMNSIMYNFLLDQIDLVNLAGNNTIDTT